MAEFLTSLSPFVKKQITAEDIISALFAISILVWVTTSIFQKLGVKGKTVTTRSGSPDLEKPSRYRDRKFGGTFLLLMQIPLLPDNVKTLY